MQGDDRTDVDEDRIDADEEYVNELIDEFFRSRMLVTRAHQMTMMPEDREIRAFNIARLRMSNALRATSTITKRHYIPKITRRLSTSRQRNVM